MWFSVVAAFSAGALHIISNKNLFHRPRQSTLDKVRSRTISYMVTNSYVLWMDAFKRQMIDCTFSRKGFQTHFECALRNNMKAFNARRESLTRSNVMKIEPSRNNHKQYNLAIFCTM